MQSDQRPASEVAYSVARWFAVGGAAQNYYVSMQWCRSQEWRRLRRLLLGLCVCRCTMGGTIMDAALPRV